MSAAVHAEDHRGDDDAPAAVTDDGYGKVGSPENDEWLEKIRRLPAMVRDNPMIAERLAAGVASAPAEPEVICGDTLDYCRCDLPRDHEGPHVCGRDDGSWRYDDDG